MPRVTLKGLRHTHATPLLELGENPKVVQERLGHSTITTTMNFYSHVTRRCRKRR
jgi:integrase